MAGISSLLRTDSPLWQMFTGVRDGTGWADYADTQYTEGSPFEILGDTDYDLPNNGGIARISQAPSGVVLYDPSEQKITGRNGDGVLITVDCKVKPTSAGTTYVEFWFDIGGAVGELYRRPLTFPKGNGVERPVNFTVSGYTLDTWEANGAQARVRANGPADIYDIRYVVTATHRARS